MKKEDENQSTNELDFVHAMGAAKGAAIDKDTSEETNPGRVDFEGSDTDKSVSKSDFTEDDDVGREDGKEFSSPVGVVGERMISLNQLTEWQHHPALGSRKTGKNAAALMASASDPANLPPIVLMPEEDGVYPIQDGRLRWHALQAVHGEESDVKVRCVMFGGSEAEAVEAACDDALGSEPRSAIENARAILNVQRVAGVSQKEIAARYSALNKDQVSRMTIAARTVEKYWPVFALLEEPDRVSIDLCVKFSQFMKSASADERESMVERTQVLTSEGASLKRNEFLEALNIEQGGETGAITRPHPLAPIESTPIMGHDDQPVGAIEMLSDDVHRLRLPDLAGMSAMQREEAADAFIKQIRIYFELDTAG